jgi:hypothetical protein
MKMKKLLTKFLDEWRNTDVPNNKLAELILAYIATNGWYLNLNTVDGLHEEKEDLVKYAEGEWK